jgi:hypothetical protein
MLRALDIGALSQIFTREIEARNIKIELHSIFDKRAFRVQTGYAPSLTDFIKGPERKLRMKLKIK